MWFPASYVGSRAAFGLLPPDVLDLPRADSGRQPARHMARARPPARCVGTGESLLDPKRIHDSWRCISSSGRFWRMPESRRLRHGDQRQLPLPEGRLLRALRPFRRRRTIRAQRRRLRSRRPDRGLDALWGDLEREGLPATVTLGEVATDPVQHAFAKIPGEVRFSASMCAAPNRR